jgi:hypothetical protein
MKSWIKTMNWSIALAIALTTTTFAQIASDNAGNYSGGWTNGSNGGTGFGAWVITANQGSGFAGHFIGDPSAAGISGMDSNAFGLYANPSGSGATVNVARALSSPLTVDQTLSFQWAVNYDADGGNKGFIIIGAGNPLISVNQGGFPGDITVNSATSGIAYGTGPMTWKFKMTSASNLLVTSTARDGSSSIVFSTNLFVADAVDAFEFYAENLGSGDADLRQPYFNDIQVTEGPEPDTLIISGSTSMLVGQTNVLTISRTGLVSDSITISNSNNGVVSAPGSTSFDSAAFSTTFEVVGVSAGMADLVAIGDVATSSVFSVTVVDLPPTPTNIYDDATFYPLGWSDGSNGGNGFGAWTFQSQGGQHLITDATANNASNAASLNTSGVAFGLVGGNGGYQEATRSFATPLGVGDSFGFSLSFQWDDQNRGFDIRSGGDAVFNLNISTNGYSWTGGNTAPFTEFTGIREFGVLVDVSITATETGFDYMMASAQDTNLNTGGSVASGSLTGFKFYNSGSSGDGGTLHFNQLAVTPSSTGFLSITGPTNVLDVATPVYTLTRNSATLVSNEVTVGSSATNLAANPGIISFEPGALTTTFRLDTLAEGSLSLLAIADGAGAASLTVDITAGPDGVYDEGSYYYGDWQDGDNNGKGFGAWAFNNDQGTGFAGTFIGDPANSGISGMDSSSFGFFANPAGSGANAEVTRTMPALQVGEAFSFVWGLNFDSGDAESNRGFDLNVGSTNLININNGDNEVITLNGSAMLTNFGSQAISITIGHETAGNLRVIATGRDGVETFTSALIPAAGAPDNFKFYFNANDGDVNRQMYLNDFAVAPYSAPPTEGSAITSFMLTGGAPTVNIDTEAGKTYTLVYTTNLLEITTVNPAEFTGWIVVEAISGEGTPITLTDTNALTDASRIYGVRISTEP